jgi:hypothetical protein
MHQNDGVSSSPRQFIRHVPLAGLGSLSHVPHMRNGLAKINRGSYGSMLGQVHAIQDPMTQSKWNPKIPDP